MLAKFIIRIAVWGLPKGIRQRYLRAWLAELEQINQENPRESLGFATSLFWNIPKMRKIKTKKLKTTKKTIGRLLFTGSTLAAVLVVLVQLSSPPTPIPATYSQNGNESALDKELEEASFEDAVITFEHTGVLENEEALPLPVTDSEGLDAISSVKPDVNVPSPVARAATASKEALEESLPETTVPAQGFAPTIQPSSESHAKSPISGYISIEQETNKQEVFPKESNALANLELDSEYRFGLTQSEPEVNYGETLTEEFTVTSNTEVLVMESDSDNNLGLDTNQNLQDMFSSIQNQSEDIEKTLAERSFMSEASSLEIEYGNAREQILPEEAKQKQVGLEKDLRKLAQSYLVSKKISKKEATEFVKILSELLELDKKTTKNYLDNLLKQVP